MSGLAEEVRSLWRRREFASARSRAAAALADAPASECAEIAEALREGAEQIGDHPEAEAAVRLSCELFARVYPPGQRHHPAVPENLALWYERVGRTQDAARVLEHCVARAEAQREAHPETLVDRLDALAAFHERHGALRDAAAVLERALSEERQRARPDRERLLSLWPRLAACQRAAGDLDGAAQSLGNALALRGRRLSADDAVLLGELAELRDAQGRLGEAVALLERALRACPPQSEARAHFAVALGRGERRLGDGTAALAHLEQARELLRRLRPPGDPTAARLADEIGALRRALDPGTG